MSHKTGYPEYTFHMECTRYNTKNFVYQAVSDHYTQEQTQIAKRRQKNYQCLSSFHPNKTFNRDVYAVFHRYGLLSRLVLDFETFDSLKTITIAT